MIPRTLLSAGLLAGVLVLPGCRRAAASYAAAPGRGPVRRAAGSAAGSPAPREPGRGDVADPRRLPPLREADVALYADVMRAAAARLEHPTAADQRLRAEAAALRRAALGTDPAHPPGDADAPATAAALRTHMDDEIVRERHIDERWYAMVRARIERALARDRREGAGDAERRRISAERDGADAALLAPRRVELERLIRRVRSGPGG